jgi:hypothetical protein
MHMYSRCVCAEFRGSAVADADSEVLSANPHRQVVCTHPRHPMPRKQYALKLAINYATAFRTRSIERLYDRDSVMLRRLPQCHPNLDSLLVEFTSTVPDDMLTHLTPVSCRVPAVAAWCEGITCCTQAVRSTNDLLVIATCVCRPYRSAS